MRYLILLLALFASTARADDAKPFNPADYPPAVQKALHYANEECESQDGGVVTFASDTVRKVDLTGDGREDYIVDFRDAKCGDRETTYCGTGGCVMTILVTLPDGSVRPVFDGYIRSYKILAPPIKRGAARTVRFDLHGSYCGGFGTQACVKERAITATPFAFKQP
ncbi:MULTISPECIES: hypothetical protein [Bradyrhizobium]|uniref:Uncharacterized protein n=1 Tax=Bradyrhizobium arachidis TaxID=858423 RepID=A0AAE7TI17_9BRAD|nr:MULTISPECIES: hypothetical protein [Bradyrhizobium]QOG17857.1 hypothetical protein FOM02_11420 [Bradyrhizobium sp. SEMIA]QOZ69473.1 hypothetical protein WN72_26520 [Bradyrhizobium arachidis]UFW45551.1 hypothetical protein BaraCB756_24845 [Bradyrhizobium arachidis]SFU75812.1 hypothetical protein SAMN05192541_104326 [Bradyrhizobium arachidis]